MYGQPTTINKSPGDSLRSSLSFPYPADLVRREPGCVGAGRQGFQNFVPPSPGRPAFPKLRAACDGRTRTAAEHSASSMGSLTHPSTGVPQPEVARMQASLTRPDSQHSQVMAAWRDRPSELPRPRLALTALSSQQSGTPAAALSPCRRTRANTTLHLDARDPGKRSSAAPAVMLWMCEPRRS